MIERRLLGGRLSVSSLSLGTAALAIPYGAPGSVQAPAAREDSVGVIRRALELGIDFIDTAPAYGDAETIVGEATARAHAIVATKVDETSPSAIRASVTASLERLGRGRLDLLQLHNARADQLADGRTLPVLAELRASGVATLIGATVYGECDALAAIESGVFDCVQIAYSVVDRRAERRVLPTARAHGISVVGRSVLLHGVLSPAAQALTGPFAPLRRAVDEFRRSVEADWDELPGAALAFVLSRSDIDSVLIGPRSVSELEQIVETAFRFHHAATAVADLQVPDELLDPRQWPGLERLVTARGSSPRATEGS